MEQTHESWHETGQDARPGPGPGAGQGLERATEADVQAQVRAWATAKLRDLTTALDPYISGVLGDVSPRHATVYLSAVKEMTRLWQAGYVPEATPAAPSWDRPEPAALARTKILEQLSELRARSGSERG